MSDSTQPQGFAFRYCSRGGQTFAADLSEYHFDLYLDAAAGSAVLDFYRSSADQPAVPIGLFSTSVENSTALRLQELVEQTGLLSLPAAPHDDLGVSLINFDVWLGGEGMRRIFHAEDMNALEQLEPLFEACDSLVAETLQTPWAAIRLDVAEVAEADGYHFEMVIENIGNHPLLIADPTALPGTFEQAAFIQVASYPQAESGITALPLNWERLPLLPPPSSSPVVAGPKPPVCDLRLNPAERWRGSTATWKAPQDGGRYLAQAVFLSYLGGADVEGTYRIRGGTFSRGLEFYPELGAEASIQ